MSVIWVVIYSAIVAGVAIAIYHWGLSKTISTIRTEIANLKAKIP